MRKLAVNTFISLDGVVQSPGGPDEDPTGGFTHGGWGVNYFDEEMMGQMAEADPYELLLGRGTYEIFAAHWPYSEGLIADHLNNTPKSGEEGLICRQFLQSCWPLSSPGHLQDRPLRLDRAELERAHVHDLASPMIGTWSHSYR
jgi:hypothetical protein